MNSYNFANFMKFTLSNISCHFLIISTLLVSCNNIPDCDDPYTTELIVQFVDSLNTTSVDTILDSIWNTNNGYVYVENDTLSVVFLEVDPVGTKTTFIFAGEDIIDTLTVDYSKNQFLRSELCGIVQRFSNIRITYSTFSDTTLVTNDLLRNSINVQVFR
ncbi:MAG: hypothetical protein O2951_11660 [Bacteroidetes bacterium]|nr:hypothetical protein [Bacteroidota bacterium]